MNDQKEIKLSSNWTYIGLYLSAILCLAFVPIFLLMLTSGEFHIGMVIGTIVFLGLTGFVIYQFIYACDARIVNDKIVLKKQFRLFISLICSDLKVMTK